MNFAKMKVGKRLGLGFALVLLFLMAITILGITRMAQIQGRLEKIVSVSNVETRLVSDMRAIVYDRMVSLRNLILLTDPDDMAPEIKKIQEQSKRYDEAEVKLSKMFAEESTTTAAEKALMQKIKENEAAAASLPAKAQELGIANNPKVATIALIKKFAPRRKSGWIA